MVEAYTNNVTLQPGESMPLDNVIIQQCSDISVEGRSTVKINRCGLRKVYVDAYGSAATAAGLIGLQLLQDGVAKPQGIAQAYSTAVGATGTVCISFEAYITIPQKNCCDCTNHGITIQEVLGTGAVAANWNHFNITVD